MSQNVWVSPAPAMPIAESPTPTGISHHRCNRSESPPNSGWMIEEPTVTTSNSAPAAE